MPHRTRRIALMLDLQWPYKRHAGIFAGTQRYANEQGWHSFIDEYVHDRLASHGPKTIPYDGIIARANLPLLKQVRRLKLPLVNVWSSSPIHDQLPGVFPDFTAGGEQCAEHLLLRGLRHFATLTPRKNVGQSIMTQAFSRVIREAGFKCQREFISQDPLRTYAHWQQTERMVIECVEMWPKPIGVYVLNEAVGRLVVQTCQQRGLRVPADVAVIAGQNEEVLCEHPRPSLTSIEYGFEKIGYEAARLLHRLMDKDLPSKRVLLVPPPGLVVRESTDFLAVDDELVATAMAFISANSHRDIGQDDVSRAVGAETRTLQNRFRKHIGRPIVTEIRRVRIERAKRELVQSKRRISDIARDAGFGQAMRMYEVFRRELGVTPSEFRKQRQLENAKSV